MRLGVLELQILGVLSCAPWPALAQDTRLLPGAKVRLHLADQRHGLSGVFLERSSDSLFIRLTGPDAGARGVGLDQVTVIETWGKRRGAVGRSLGIGTAIGAGAGILVGAAIPPPCESDGWCIGPQDTGDMIVVGLLGAAVVGGLVGLVAGLARPNGWTRIDLSSIQFRQSTEGARLTWQLPLPAIRAP